MKIIFYTPFKKEIELSGNKTVKQLAQELNFSLESHVVLKNGKMVTPDELIKDEDTVEVLSAISGG
ncbi:MoaD/ThiS family protein [Thermovenabulum gondwanense]|uniref:Sulfur carrier protein ThiS n=1 Tax=Thermovenabulum gondwanense TaxID=520767 RepID=A0A162N1I8_9FIRM|nr:MoaD/ThiS family protein [Thermovenabulum gondwanense]KYO68671.1 hypothetical protein ATZ99_01800 [Thermovenabulum gondwanense]